MQTAGENGTEGCDAKWPGLYRAKTTIPYTEGIWAYTEGIWPFTKGTWPYTEGTWMYCDYYFGVYLVLWLF